VQITIPLDGIALPIVSATPARPRNAGPRIWIDSSKQGGRCTVKIMLTGTDMDMINLIDQLHLLIHDRQDMPAVTALHDMLCDRTSLVARTWPPTPAGRSRADEDYPQDGRDHVHGPAILEHLQRKGTIDFPDDDPRAEMLYSMAEYMLTIQQYRDWSAARYAAQVRAAAVVDNNGENDT